MSEKPVYVVSDIHLGAVPPATEREFRGFLDHVAREAASLLINGDLFDFWFEYRSVIPREHYRVLAKLAEVVEAGVRVWFMGGNHDAWVGSFLRDEVGVELLNGQVEMMMGGRRALVAHGDGLGEGDYKYRALKAVLRNPLCIRAFRLIHPDLGLRLGGGSSRTDRKTTIGDHGAGGRSTFIRAWAEERLRADPSLQLVLTGHAHRASVDEVEPGRFYVNSGDWLGANRQYVVLPVDGGAPELRSWEGKVLSP